MTKINRFYRQAAINLMSINITDSEMYALIPSENDEQTYYRVDMSEETMQATKCGCKGFCRWNKCKHVAIVNAAFDGYKAPVEEKITEVEKGEWYILNKNTQVWMNDGEWIAIGPTENAIETVKAHLEMQSAVTEAENIVAQPAPKRDVYWDDNHACECYVDTRKPTGNMEGIDFGDTPMRWNAQEECFEEVLVDVSGERETEITVKRKPRKYATEYLENQAHYGKIKSQMAEIRERREAMLDAPLNGNKAFAVI